jgi:hypothetical protein
VEKVAHAMADPELREIATVQPLTPPPPTQTLICHASADQLFGIMCMPVLQAAAAYGEGGACSS